MPDASLEERLSTLISLGALSHVARPSLDRLTELTSETLRASIAFVSLVEVDRQRFVSRKGLTLSEMHIRDSICAHTISFAKTLVVPDLLKDPRFSSNPLVIGPDQLRFYAGAPLIAQNGVPIGALCVMDKEPREFSPQQYRQLETLSMAVMSELELRALADRREPVSGLPNRQQFSIDYNNWSARSPGLRCFAVVVDVLDPARANEADQVLGMPPLEALIKQAGARIKAALDDFADVYHIGATRFAFIAELPSPDAVQTLVGELKARLIRPVLAAGVPMSPIFHAGICQIELGRESAEDVVRKVLIGLYSAIASSNSLCWYSPERDNALRRGYRLATDAEEGLRNNQFYLVYQPRFRSTDLRPISAEVLLRWNHPTKGLVSPAEFIPVFERTALMECVTNWVIHQAVTQLSEWRRQGLDLTLSINISANDLARKGMAADLAAMILTRGLNCSDVEIEITEGEWLGANSLPGENIKLMAAAGIRLAVDDFGSGYSNFGYLTELPIQTLKLDKSLIDDLCNDQKALLKVQAIICLAHELGYNTVAEGVESPHQIATLQSLGCDEVQGFALSRPLDAAQLVELLTLKPEGTQC